MQEGRSAGGLMTAHGTSRAGGVVMRVAAVNRAAQAAAGIMPGLALSDARARLPDLRTVPAEPAADAQALQALAAWCGRWTPWTAADEAGLAAAGPEHGVWLDITGAAHLFGGEAALLTDLVGRLRRFGFAARAALADTPGAAWALGRHSGKPTRIVPPGRQRAALARLPVTGLRLDAADAEALERLGLRSIGDLYALPRGALGRRFGAGVLRRLDQALGRADEPISPRQPVTPICARVAFAEPIASVDAIAHATRRLLDTLCARLEKKDLGARCLALTLYRVDGKVEHIAAGTSAPARAPKHLMRLLEEQLEAVDPGFGIEVMTLDAPRTERQDAAAVPLDGLALGEVGDSGVLSALVDRLGSRYGLENVRRLGPQESHVPERAQRAVSPLAPPAAWDWANTKRRPLRLLPRPEAVEAVAMVPDDPPVMFRWRRVLHRVVRAEGPERIATEWWRRGAGDRDETKEDAIRDYYRVEDAEGRRFWLFRDAVYRPGMTPGWWLHGIFG